MTEDIWKRKAIETEIVNDARRVKASKAKQTVKDASNWRRASNTSLHRKRKGRQSTVEWARKEMFPKPDEAQEAVSKGEGEAKGATNLRLLEQTA